MLLYDGISLMIMFGMFISSSVIISIDLCLMWLLKWLNMMLFIGCLMKLIVNVLNVVSVLMIGFSDGKKMWLNMSVVVVL